MGRLRNLIAALLYFCPSLAIAASDYSFKNVCSVVDPTGCKQYLYNPDGSEKLPPNDIILLMARGREPMKQIAKLYDVKPEALMVSVLTENSLNYGLGDSVVDMILKFKGSDDKDGTLLGRPYSIGLGQILVSAAQKVEPLAAQIENRPIRSTPEIAQALKTDYGSLNYAAAILRTAQDTYKKYGFDVSEDPVILATLYNLGKYEERAKAAQERGTPPQANYYGGFAAKHMSLVRAALEGKPRGADGKLIPFSTEKVSNTAYRLKDSVKIYSMAPYCRKNSGKKEHRYEEIMSRTELPPIATKEKAEKYKIISRDIDCDLNDWVLVEFEDGTAGWALERQIVATSDALPESKIRACKKAQDPTCMARAQSIEGLNSKGYNDKTGELEIALTGKEGSVLVDYLAYHPSKCEREQVQQDPYTYQPIALREMTPLNREDVPKVLEQLGQKQSELLRSMRLDGGWQNPKNPLRHQMRFAEELQACRRKSCTFSRGAFDDLMREPVPERMTVKAAKRFEILMKVTSARRDVVKAGSSHWLGLLREAKNYCRDVLVKLPQTREFFEKLEKILASDFDGLKMRTKQIDDLLDIDALKNTCLRARKLLIENGEISESPDDAETEACPSCLEKQAAGGSMSVQAARLESLLHETSDIDEMAVSPLKAAEEKIGRRIYDDIAADDYCQYDPFASAKMVEKLAKLDCVERIYVPDVFILKSLTEHRKKILRKRFDTNDKFSIQFKPKCEGPRGFLGIF